MKIDGNEIRPGNVIEHKGGLWLAVKTDHVKPGKGGAYMQVELKNLRDGTKLNERFRAAETVERVRLEQRKFQYLYGDEHTLTFMDGETYEQTAINTQLIGDKTVYLQDGMEVQIEFHEEEALSVILPETVTLEIVETEPTVKGQTAAASYKPAILNNGLRVMVPPFVASGEVIVVNTADGSYSKRAD